MLAWLTRSRKHAAPIARRSVRPDLEGLEHRNLMAVIQVVPLDQPVDVTHRHSVADAMPFAGTNGTVQIEPGATADVGTVNVTISGITITGDPNVPGASLAKYNFNINADNITLANMNLGDVSASATADHLTITRSLLDNFFETGALSGAGFNTLSQNIISGAVSLEGNSGPGQPTNDTVTLNTFRSNATIILKLTNSNNSVVSDNTFVGDKTGQYAIQVRSNSDGVVINNNHIELFGSSTIGIVLLNTGGAAGNILSARVSNNIIETNDLGTGLLCNLFGTGQFFTAQVQGNDFHHNLVGVEINGLPGATGAGNIDLGGGSNSLGSSLGGNNFRGFTGTNGNYAIYLHNTEANISVPATHNIFDYASNPEAVVRDGSNGGSGTIDNSSKLSRNGALVQNLYQMYLGRSGTFDELNGWLNVLPSIGRSGVVNGIVTSAESLSRIVNRFYIQYLGRTGDGPGLASWVSQLQNGVSLTSVESGFVASAEYLSHVNTDVVQALYINLLQRPGTSAELASWYNVMPQLGFKGVVEAFTNSAEHRNRIISDDFNAILHREASASDLVTFANQPADPLALQIALLNSEEFYQNG